MNRGRFTKQAKAQRAAGREALAAAMFRAKLFAKRPRGRPRKRQVEPVESE